MDLRELSDRLEITDLLLRYSHAVDFMDWDEFRSCFTTDAHIDYTAFGGPAGDLEETVAFLTEAMPRWTSRQHMISPPLITIDGDSATARTMCHNPMGFLEGEDPRVLVCGLWYVDELRRTPDGWRISRRSEERSHVATFAPPPARF